MGRIFAVTKNSVRKALVFTSHSACGCNEGRNPKRVSINDGDMGKTEQLAQHINGIIYIAQMT